MTSRRKMLAAHVIGIGLGVAADAVLGDPRRFHPVAGYGTAAARLERRLYAPTRAAGTRFTAIAVGVPVVAATVAHVATRRRPYARGLLLAATTWAVLGGTSLRREATAMAAELERHDLSAARRRVPHLCGRDPRALDAPEIARATVESVAENTSDAQVGPLVWGALAGLPGLVGYRAANTLDAMVGHRSDRYRDFGTASARLDDAVNLVPSRLTAALTVLAAPFVAPASSPASPSAAASPSAVASPPGSASPARRSAAPAGSAIARPGGGVWRRLRRLRIRDGFRALVAWRRDGGKHPSPNSGQCEAAMAGALGVRLGGRNVYRGRVEVRPTLGRGPLPGPAEVRRAAAISGAVGLAAFGVTAAARVAASRRRSRRRSAR